MYVAQYCANDNRLEQILTLLLPTLVQRLGMNDIVEPSEEIRLKSVSLLLELCRVVAIGLVCIRMNGSVF